MTARDLQALERERDYYKAMYESERRHHAFSISILAFCIAFIFVILGTL